MVKIKKINAKRVEFRFKKGRKNEELFEIAIIIPRRKSKVSKKDANSMRDEQK